MAAKNTLAAAGMAGLESLVQSLMPQVIQKLEAIEKRISQLDERLSSLEKRVDSRFTSLEKRVEARFNELEKKLDARFHELDGKLDARVHELEVKMYDRFESTRDVINEVASRVTGVDKKVDAYVSIARHFRRVQGVARTCGSR